MPLTRSQDPPKQDSSSSSSSSASLITDQNSAKPDDKKLVAKAIADLKAIRQKRASESTERHDAYVQLRASGEIRLNTGKMHERSRREVYNYAYLVNKYIMQHKGKVKVKGTRGKKRDQSGFCSEVRARNVKLFEALNARFKCTDAMFSVVGHIPDECMQVRKFGESHNQMAAADESGINQAPGWMPMTNQANNLVSKIFSKAVGEDVRKIVVDDLTPDVLISTSEDDKDVNQTSQPSAYSSSSSSASNNSSNNNGPSARELRLRARNAKNNGGSSSSSSSS